ncbi:hypothetical protein CROQUDRAFT_106744 [Cronartium quercuum f. sp. fusiforme G11]|uniref:Uncharacterized protein n=1 Tax=Cronartium quercuum f. sp. fusiforme G11 TaxID=708437 RepID=A0A9P6NJZ5_9BASI|nr:hypothetical protein CROQUDRAFT_106744 [Cronartium quercuum f. sp. fusiforme G11]
MSSISHPRKLKVNETVTEEYSTTVLEYEFWLRRKVQNAIERLPSTSLDEWLIIDYNQNREEPRSPERSESSSGLPTFFTHSLSSDHHSNMNHCAHPPLGRRLSISKIIDGLKHQFTKKLWIKLRKVSKDHPLMPRSSPSRSNQYHTRWPACFMRMKMKKADHGGQRVDDSI